MWSISLNIEQVIRKTCVNYSANKFKRKFDGRILKIYKKVNGLKGLEILSDLDLVEVYEKAIAMNLEEDFTEILLNEIDRRGIKNLEATIC